MSVTCSQGHENPDGSMYCDQCGEELPIAAPASGASAPPTPDYPDASVAPAAPAAVGAARLTLKEGGAEFSLEGKSEFLVGREDPVSNIYPDIDLTPYNGEDYGVSRMHAKIYIQGGQYLVEDLEQHELDLHQPPEARPQDAYIHQGWRRGPLRQGRSHVPRRLSARRHETPPSERPSRPSRRDGLSRIRPYQLLRFHASRERAGPLPSFAADL